MGKQYHFFGYLEIPLVENNFPPENRDPLHMAAKQASEKNSSRPTSTPSVDWVSPWAAWVSEQSQRLRPFLNGFIFMFLLGGGTDETQGSINL